MLALHLILYVIYVHSNHIVIYVQYMHYTILYGYLFQDVDVDWLSC